MMQQFKLLIIDEDRPLTSDRPIWEAHYVLERKKDGTLEVIKDRFNYPGNKNVVEIGVPC